MPTRLIEPVSADGSFDEAGATWGVTAVGAPGSRYDGRGVSVALLDTGVDRSHLAFQGVTLEERDFSGTGPDDAQGHGTHCAGAILGRDVGKTRIGVARGASRLLAGKILADEGAGSTEMMVKGLIWALAEGAQVISLSVCLDFPAMVRDLTESGWPPEPATSRALGAYGETLRMLETLLDIARSPSPFGMGAVVVAAAGNDSRREEDPRYSLPASLPGATEGVISVGAVARDGNLFRIGPFSNASQVCAPGVEIVSARLGGGLSAMTGTSMACPHVAGAAALWWEALREQGLPATAETVTAKLLATCRTDVFSLGVRSADYGVGLVSAP
jgi:subtilisin family serine protease